MVFIVLSLDFVIVTKKSCDIRYAHIGVSIDKRSYPHFQKQIRLAIDKRVLTLTMILSRGPPLISRPRKEPCLRIEWL